jgi:hypothetical protein
MVRHPVTPKYRRTRLFVLTLGYNGKASAESSARRWAELHEEAFRRLGGAVRVVVLANLKEGVLRPDVYDPALNPLYRDVLAHYGALALPCRVGVARSQGQGRVGNRPHAAHRAQGPALRAPEDAQAALPVRDLDRASRRLRRSRQRLLRPAAGPARARRGVGRR